MSEWVRGNLYIMDLGLIISSNSETSYCSKMSVKRKPVKIVSSPGSIAKKRKPLVSAVTGAGLLTTADTETQDSVPSPAPSVDESEVTSSTKQYVFKDPNFKHSCKLQNTSKKGKCWKNLKQIVQLERSLPWSPDDPIYSSMDAPPSFKPAKKYSDLSGLPSKYTDPTTKLRYATTDEYSRVGQLPSDIVSGLLQIRKANALVP